MFYNAPIIPACRDVTTFEYKGKYWRCARLPFGIQPAPYFAMRLMKVVMDWIRSKGLACWCHIDDILITGDNRGYLEAIGAKVVERLEHADWKISKEKSVLRPVEQVEYLGVYVSQEGIAQTPKIARMKSNILPIKIKIIKKIIARKRQEAIKTVIGTRRSAGSSQTTMTQLMKARYRCIMGQCTISLQPNK